MPERRAAGQAFPTDLCDRSGKPAASAVSTLNQDDASYSGSQCVRKVGSAWVQTLDARPAVKLRDK
jgi:hypothetical protein